MMIIKHWLHHSNVFSIPQSILCNISARKRIFSQIIHVFYCPHSSCASRKAAICENHLTSHTAGVASLYGDIHGAKYMPLKRVQLPNTQALPCNPDPRRYSNYYRVCAFARRSARTFGYAKLPGLQPQCGHRCRHTFSLPFNWINFLSAPDATCALSSLGAPPTRSEIRWPTS